MNEATAVQTEADAAMDALLDCKKCGARPTTESLGGIMNAEHRWVCSACDNRPTAAKTYASAYDKWQAHNAPRSQHVADGQAAAIADGAGVMSPAPEGLDAKAVREWRYGIVLGWKQIAKNKKAA